MGLKSWRAMALMGVLGASAGAANAQETQDAALPDLRFQSSPIDAYGTSSRFGFGFRLHLRAEWILVGGNAFNPNPLSPLVVIEQVDPDGSARELASKTVGTTSSRTPIVATRLDSEGNPIQGTQRIIATEPSTAFLVVDWDPPAGVYEIRVTLDPDDKIRESDETNNRLVQSVKVFEKSEYRASRKRREVMGEEHQAKRETITAAVNRQNIEAIVALFADPDAIVRQQAMMALGSFPRREAEMAAMEKFLDSPFWSDRLGAATALGRDDDVFFQRNRERLEAMIRSDLDPSTREAIAGNLRDRFGPEIAPGQEPPRTPPPEDVDLPFVNDPALRGDWESVDFVARPSDFQPGRRSWPGYVSLDRISFYRRGETSEADVLTWTLGNVIHRADRIAAPYEIRTIGGESYLFLAWEFHEIDNGSSTARRALDPWWHVFKRR